VDQNTISLVSVITTILIALVGYVVTYVNTLRLEQQKAQLARVEQQLRDLYGPLLSLVSSSAAAYAGFRSIYRPNTRFFRSTPPPTQEDLDAWCLWMTEVFMPLNESMTQLVTNHTDLLEEDEIPQCLLSLCAHVSGYKAVLKAWENNDHSRYSSVVNFPSEELHIYAKERFVQLKLKQAILLGHNQSKARPRKQR
jgi:hypothetical protein